MLTQEFYQTGRKDSLGMQLFMKKLPNKKMHIKLRCNS